MDLPKELVLDYETWRSGGPYHLRELKMITPNISPGVQSPPKYEEIIDWFERNGWKEGKPNQIDYHQREWYNRYPDEPCCKTNQPKALKIVARLFVYRVHEADHVGLDLKLTAEPVEDDGWISFMAYGFEGVDKIPNQVERLLTAWRAIAKENK